MRASFFNCCLRSLDQSDGFDCSRLLTCGLGAGLLPRRVHCEHVVAGLLMMSPGDTSCLWHSDLVSKRELVLVLFVSALLLHFLGQRLVQDWTEHGTLATTTKIIVDEGESIGWTLFLIGVAPAMLISKFIWFWLLCHGNNPLVVSGF